MRYSVALLVALGFAGCSAALDDAEGVAPTIEITSPQRGTQIDGSTVTVTGVVKDDGPVTLTVAGTAVTPAADGSFSATITVSPGLELIETHATDRSGNASRDVRAVMSGPLAPTDGSRAAPVAARAGTAAIAAVGALMAQTAEAIDFTAAVKAMNPVYDNDGCLGARVNVTSVTLSNIDVALVAGAGGLATEVVIDDVAVRASASYKVACIGGSTTITLRAAKARIKGTLGAAVSGTTLATSMTGASVTLEGFALDASGIPGALEDLFRNQVRKAVENALTKVIRDRAPGMADAALADMLAQPFSAGLLGHDTSITVLPREVTLSAEGLYVAVDTTVRVTGGEGGMFVSSATPVSAALMPSTGVGLAVADDLANQLFSGLWAADAFEQHLTVDQIGVVASLIDENAATLDLAFALPPTVRSAAGALELAIGDMLLTVRDASGVELQTLSLSLRTSIAATPTSGAVALTLGEPTVFAQVLSQSAAVSEPLTADKVEGIVKGAWGIVRGQAETALASLPLPTVGGVAFGTPSVTGVAGFVIADIAVN